MDNSPPPPLHPSFHHSSQSLALEQVAISLAKQAKKELNCLSIVGRGLESNKHIPLFTLTPLPSLSIGK